MAVNGGTVVDSLRPGQKTSDQSNVATDVRFA